MNDRNFTYLAQRRRSCREMFPSLSVGIARLRCLLVSLLRRQTNWNKSREQPGTRESFSSPPSRKRLEGRIMLTLTQFPRAMKDSRPGANRQPQPHTPGLTRKMVRAHACRVFRDVFPARALTYDEWRLVEADLARRLESTGW